MKYLLLLICLTLPVTAEDFFSGLHGGHPPLAHGEVDTHEHAQSADDKGLERLQNNLAEIQNNQEELLLKIREITERINQINKQIRVVNPVLDAVEDRKTLEVVAQVRENQLLIENKLRKLVPQEEGKKSLVKDQKTCFENQKQILHAIAQYNLDRGENLVVSGESELEKLKDQGLLKKVPEDPGCNKSDNYRSDKVGNIWCVVHGHHLGVDGVTPDGEVDSTKAIGTGKCQ